MSLLSLGRKDFEQNDRLPLLAVESEFPSSAGKWQMKDLQKDLSFSEAQASLLSAQSVSTFLFTSVFLSHAAAFPAAHCPEEQWPRTAAQACLNCRVTALGSEPSIFLHWQLLLDCWPQLLLRLLFKTWTVFHLCSSTGAAPEKVAAVDTMACSFLSLFPVAALCYPSFLTTGKVKCFKVSSEGNQKACAMLGG